MKAKCEVCYYVDGDTTRKEVTFCKPCESWICAKCKPNWVRRGMAALKKKIL